MEEGKKQIITRIALGAKGEPRGEVLGALYDARSDQFVLGHGSVFKKSVGVGVRYDTVGSEMDEPEVKLKISNYANLGLSGRFELLAVPPEQQVSILTGTADLEWRALMSIGNYLNPDLLNNSMMTRSVEGSVLLRWKTVKETLDIGNEDEDEDDEDEGSFDCLDLNSIGSGVESGATHVVVGVTHGAVAVASCQYLNMEERPVEEVETWLKLLLEEKLSKVKPTPSTSSDSDSFSVPSSSGPVDDLKIRVYGNIFPASGPAKAWNLKTATELLEQVPSLIQDNLGGIGVPLIYHLLPITKLSSSSAVIYRTLPGSSVTSILEMSNEIAKAHQRVNEVYEDGREAVGHCLNHLDLLAIMALKKEMVGKESEFASKVGQAVAKFRGGQLDDIRLREQIDGLPIAGFTSELDNKFGDAIEKLGLFKLVRNLPGAGKYIGYDTSIDEEICKDLESKAVILYFNKDSKKNKERWNGNQVLFFQEAKMNPRTMSSSGQTRFFVLDCDIHPDIGIPLRLSSAVQVVQGGKVLCESMLEEIAGPPADLMETDSDTNAVGDGAEGGATASTNGQTEELNILILGETGVGKSTWINAFVNFMHSDSLEEAELQDPINLIPSKFTVYDENFEEITVNTAGRENGDPANEETKVGQSATQKSKVYSFQISDNTVVRLIDTPGIGDTRGIDQDCENFKNILDTLSNLDKLHGICILLKPNNARVNVMFRFCIKELLTHLHRDAAQNIVFCFTNSRGTFYRPGDTMPALKSVINEYKTRDRNKYGEVKIDISKETVYCFDSEAYRFLAAIKNPHRPVTFSEQERQNFSQSWEKSLIETRRLLDYFRGLKPHPIKSTLNLNHSRELVLKLTRPLAEITRNIETNKAIVEDERKMIEDTEENIEQLMRNIMTTRTEIEVTRINYPKTVCSNRKCVKIWNVGGGACTTEYVQICHDHCNLTGVQSDCIGDPGLMQCWSMVPGTGFCKHPTCRHSYREHLHVYYESRQVVRAVEDQAVLEALKSSRSAKEAKKKMIEGKTALIREFEEELQRIQESSIRFAYFLKANAITPYNDAMIQYLDHLIREEGDKIACGGNRTTMEALKRGKASYLEKIKILESKMMENLEFEAVDEVAFGSQNEFSAENMEKLVNELKGLKHSGESLKEALDCITNMNSVVHTSAIVRVPSGPRRSQRGWDPCNRWSGGSDNAYANSRERYGLNYGYGGGYHTSQRAASTSFFGRNLGGLISDSISFLRSRHLSRRNQ